MVLPVAPNGRARGGAPRDLPGRPDPRLLLQPDSPPFAQSLERRGGGRSHRQPSVGSQAAAGPEEEEGRCRLWWLSATGSGAADFP